MDSIKRAAERIAGRIDAGPGDFVNMADEFGDVWHEVASAYDTALVIYDGRRPGGTEYVFRRNVRRVHRAGEPWADRTVRIVCTGDGDFGRTKAGSVRPLPAMFGEPSV